MKEILKEIDREINTIRQSLGSKPIGFEKYGYGMLKGLEKAREIITSQINNKQTK